jgi:hypothetical protein
VESTLYMPVKRFLEGLGFEVKGEICGCDLVALRQGEPAAVVIGLLSARPDVDEAANTIPASKSSAACSGSVSSW